MKRIIILYLILHSVLLFSCKEEKRFIEPTYVLQNWSKAIRNLNYRNYSRYESYPKEEGVFREMYSDYYIINLLVTDVVEEEDNIRKDHDGNRYKYKTVHFEGGVVRRKDHKPYQVLRGDAEFVLFLDGKRADDGWLISNRTFMRINR